MPTTMATGSQTREADTDGDGIPDDSDLDDDNDGVGDDVDDDDNGG